MWTVKDGHDSLPHGGASCRSSGGGRGGRGGILADFITHLSRYITQTPRNRLASPEALNASVQEADPPEQQVRAVTQGHGDCYDDDGGDSQPHSNSRGSSADITPLSSLCFPCLVAQECSCHTNQTRENIPVETKLQWTQRQLNINRRVPVSYFLALLPRCTVNESKG